jgi:23S rRNA (pseudouridine1915-N3)-methyltransferase
VKFVFLTVETKSPAWLNQAKSEYQKKIAPFYGFEEIEIKSPQISRDDQNLKIKKEEEKILSRLLPNDLVVVFDEKGKSYRSIEFSKELVKRIETSPSRMVFIIGGAFGLSEEVKSRANWKIALSEMTMNHWVAQVMALEQIYRALAISRNLPYHNE